MANMKKLFITAMVIVFTFMTIPAFAQSAKEAIYALKKLKVRVEAGISYRDYSPALGDAKFPVTLFMENADAKKYPELTVSMDTVMKHYEFAGTLWTQKIRQGHGRIYVDMYKSQGKEIKELYPQVKTEYVGRGEPRYEIDDLLPLIWAEASKELDNTTKIYAKTEGDTSNDIDKLKKENEQLKAENTNLKNQIELLKSKRNK